MTDPDLPSHGGLREPSLAQGYHLLVLSQAGLSFCPTHCTVLRKHLRRFLSLRSWDGLGSCWLCLTFPLSGEVTRENPFQSLTKVFEEMEPICRLRGSWNRFSGGGSVVASSISTHQLNFWVGCHPGG
jgi:hypothetical protein